MTKEVTLKIMSGVVIAGRVARPGDIVTGVPEALAKNLLTRGKAELSDPPTGAGGGTDTVTGAGGGTDTATGDVPADAPAKKKAAKGAE